MSITNFCIFAKIFIIKFRSHCVPNLSQICLSLKEKSCLGLDSGIPVLRTSLENLPCYGRRFVNALI